MAKKYTITCNQGSSWWAWTHTKPISKAKIKKTFQAIRTTSGVVFRPSDAMEFLNFEQWEKYANILGRYTFHGENPENVFVIGCHRIPREELELLREMMQGGGNV